MAAGAALSISGVGFIKMRIYRFGQSRLSAVQKTPKIADVISARRSVSRIRLGWPAPKLVEMIGCEACPTLYAQHCTKVLTLMIGP